MEKGRGKLLTIETAPGPGPDRLRQASFSGDLGDDRKTINVVPHLAINSGDDQEADTGSNKPAPAPCSTGGWYCRCVTTLTAVHLVTRPGTDQLSIFR